MKNNSLRLFFWSGLFIFLILTTTCKELEKSMLVSTDEATNVLTNSADLPGMIIDLGNGATQHGHYYGKTANPSTDHTLLGAPGSVTGFTSQVINLEAGTKYYFKAYITDGQETVYGKEKSFITVAASAPALTTTAVTSITLTGAVSGGNITSDGGAPITARGVCWGSFTAPTITNSKTSDAAGTGTFTSTLTGLTAGSTYFLRAYATNSAGTTYGNELTFTTTAASVPAVTTATIISITYMNASGGGNVVSDGGSPVLERGVCWSTATGPTISNTKAANGSGTGQYVCPIDGLTATTKYYVRAYATNIVGTSYGTEVSFTTSAAPVQLPVLTTVSPGNVTSISATSGGDISGDGGATITSRGVCWNTTGSPSAELLHTTDGTGTGPFASSIAGLTPNTKYYVRAYAVNSTGTGYGNEYSFTTLSASSAVLTTSALTSITQTTATGGGNITSDGGSAITARGVCWSLIQNPTLADAFTVNDFSTGIFNSQLINLLPGRTYYVRAYATNSTGTTYGNQVSFLTASDIPKVTTSAVGTVTATTADVGGEVLDNNGSTTTTRGICYNLIGSPTIGDNIKSESASLGTFTMSLTGLIPNTKYYAKVFATNGIGTAYGNEVTFTTNVLTSTVPGAPTGVSATTGYVQSVVTFTAPVNNGGSPITVYTVTSSPGGFTGTGSASPITVTSLPALISYTFTVTATNIIGTGPASSASNSVTPTTVPEAPTIGTATKGNAQATVTFTAPVNNGGSAITGYTVTSNPGGITGTGSASPVTVTGLTNGTSYIFTVTATNANGTGTGSSSSNSVTPSTVPGAPTISTAIGGNAQASVSFSAPTSDGGSAITGYTVTSNPDGKTGTGSTSPIIVNGLVNKAYTFTITATNVNGTGPSSAVSNSVIPSTVPGSPVIGTAVKGNGQATVAFAAPASDGGSAITAYTATSSPGGYTGSGLISPVTVTGLTNGTTYTFTIIASNINGDGPASSVSNSVIPSTVSGPPTIGTATGGNAQASVSFTPPVSDGGSAITGYTVTSNPDGITGTGSASPIIVTGLVNKAYTFTITATNSNGTGPSSAISNSVIPSTVPGPPVIGTAVKGNGQATVAFAAPASDGGSAITAYTAISSPGGYTGSGLTSPVTVTGLTNGTTYTFTIIASNINGDGLASSVSNSIIPSTVPGPPTIGTATGGNAQASVSFSAPLSDGGSALTGYTVTSSPGGFTAIGLTSPIVVSGLSNTAYTFTVTATNINGTGLASSASNSATPTTVPGPPTIGTATGGNAQASVSFTAPVSNGGSAITGYTVTSNPDGITGTGSASPIIVTGLVNKAYTFTVTAANSNGTGPASSASNSVVPTTVPGAPTIGTAIKGNAMATVTFTAPASNGGSPITGYTVTSSPGSITGTGSGSPVTVSELINGTAYTFTVTATNVNGTGLASSASNSVTPSTVPGAPTIGTATAGDTQASVKFTAPASNGGSAITGYTVTSNPGGKTGTGTGSPITVTGLTNLTAYTFTVVATNINGNSASSPASNSVIPGTITNSTTGKIWMDRNLGASRASVSQWDAASYGDLYQWGRAADGHQIRTSGTTTTLSSSDNPGHGAFILAPASPNDWRSPQNANLWQGVSGVNNPCPAGYRLPTEVEWNAEQQRWFPNNADGAYFDLKMSIAGYRSSNGLLIDVGTRGHYWSSTVSGTHSRYLYIVSDPDPLIDNALIYSEDRAFGGSVRCIKN